MHNVVIALLALSGISALLATIKVQAAVDLLALAFLLFVLSVFIPAAW